VAALLNGPTAPVIDSHGDIIFADRDNSAIRRVNQAGTIGTLIGPNR
jgi:hypothetical protein